MISNDTTMLQAHTDFHEHIFYFDFPRFKIGVAEYEAGPTGCTVFLFPEGAATAIDIRGGLPGTVNNWEWNHAICLAGGSLYGLEATFGVAAELFAERNYSLDDFALVSGSIIYDFGSRDNCIYPDKQLGRAAIRAARSNAFPVGLRGAGRSANCGWFHTEPSGQCAAFRQIGDTKIAVFSVLNCSGTIINRQGQPVKGNLDPVTGRRTTFLAEVERRLGGIPGHKPPQGNTTLTVVITNQRLSATVLSQFGRQIHTAMGQFIQPFHTPEDGDVLYAITTNDVDNESIDATALAAISADLLWDAALSLC